MKTLTVVIGPVVENVGGIQVTCTSTVRCPAVCVPKLVVLVVKEVEEVEEEVSLI